MAEEQNKESVLGGLRSRLPKFPTKGAAEAETPDAPGAGSAAPASSTPTASTPAASPSVSAPVSAPPATGAGNQKAPKNQQKPVTSTPPAPSTQAQPSATPAPALAANGQSTSALTEDESELSVEEAHLQHLQYLVEEFGQVQEDLHRMYRLVEEISERESAQEKVFNTLHAELRDYKNDFIYEHLKPVVRPLLFLYDSLEQFDAEIALYERPTNGERRQSGLSPQLVRENISFFRDQLVEALRICEVTPMETPKGTFNPKLHKVIDVVPVEPAQDGMIQRVVRSGWYLNGALLRSAEVIVGKKMEHVGRCRSTN